MKINLEKKHVYLIVGLFVFLAGLLFVTAAWTEKPVWHSGDNVKIGIGGTDYSLQEAITNELIGKSPWILTGSDVYYNTGKVGIGTTGPAEKLVVNGELGIGEISGQPLAQFQGYADPDSGNNGGTLYIKTRNGQTGSRDTRMAIKYNGNVGIGTASPTAKLEVSSSPYTMKYGHHVGYLEVNRANAADGSFGLWMRGGAGGTDWSLYQGPSSNDLRFHDGAIDAVTFKQGGTVGIGVTNPTAKLHVQAYQNENGIYTHASEVTTNYYIAEFASGGASRVYIRADGNVGIGTKTPQSKLTTNGDSYAASRSGGAIDIAEWTKTNDNLEAGDVVIIDNKNPEKIKKSNREYDTTVAGIISTRPHLTMGEEFKGDDAVKLALAGRVPVKATAENGAIQPGDLLTTSSLPGHAMKCNDKIKCIGAIVGKALEPLDEGHGKIMALLTLQ